MKTQKSESSLINPIVVWIRICIVFNAVAKTNCVAPNACANKNERQ